MMEETVSDKVLAKIKKLLALATSSNEHEAALAASKAQELLVEHNLSMLDIESFNMDKNSIFEDITEESISWGNASLSVEKWKEVLHYHIAKTTFCRSLRTRGNGNKDFPKYGKFTFIGERTNVMVAVGLYNFLSEQIIRLTAESDVLGFVAKRSFSYGCAVKVTDRLLKLFEANQIKPKFGELMVVSDRAITAYVNKNVKMSKKKRKFYNSSLDERAYSAGNQAGDRVNLKLQHKLQG